MSKFSFLSCSNLPDVRAAVISFYLKVVSFYYAVRRQIGTVLQNNKLNTGSVFQNVTGNLNELTDRDICEALRLVGLDEEIRQMPMGLYSMISEGGGTLSGGQRQRLLLAQALANKPQMLIMDEATSFLDNQTQEIVTRSLDKMKITRIIIAHRLSTIINADTIYVIHNGLRGLLPGTDGKEGCIRRTDAEANGSEARYTL